MRALAKTAFVAAFLMVLFSTAYAYDSGNIVVHDAIVDGTDPCDYDSGWPSWSNYWDCWINDHQWMELKIDSIPSAGDYQVVFTGYFSGSGQANEDLRITINGDSFVWAEDNTLAEGWYTNTVQHVFRLNQGANYIRLDGFAGSIHFGTFKIITFVNTAPVINGIPDATTNVNTAPPANFIDLLAYAMDDASADNELAYSIAGQSNSSLISCSVTGNRYVNCNAPAANTVGFSDVNVKVSDPQGLGDYDIFRINVVNTPPSITGLPDFSTMLNTSLPANFLNLRTYASDAETAAAGLAYSILSQSNASLIDCYITGNQYVNCSAPRTNRVGSSYITVLVADPIGSYATDVFRIDVNGNFTSDFNASPVLVERNYSNTAGFTLDNTSAAEICIDINATSADSRIDVNISPETTCIGTNELAEFTLLVSSNNAPEGDYNAGIEIGYGSNAEIIDYTIRVAGNIADIDVDSAMREFYILQDTGIAALFTITNNSNERKCLDLKTGSSSAYINTGTGSNTICLGGRQAVELGIDIFADEDADAGRYTAWLSAGYNGSKDSAEVDVYVSSTGDIGISTGSKSICKGKNGKLSVKVENNSGTEEYNVKLYAGTESFMPTISPAEVDLAADETKYSELAIRTNSTTKPGNYSASITAVINDSAVVLEKAGFSIIDCHEVQEETVAIDVNADCALMDKNSSIDINFLLINLLPEEQSVKIVSDGDLVSKPEFSSLLLEADENFAILLNVKADAETETGKHSLGLYAYNDTTSVKKTLCIEVLKTRLIGIIQLSGEQDARRGSTIEYAFLVQNAGDYNETYTASIANSYNDIDVNVSNTGFSLATKNSRQITASITVDIDAVPGNRAITLRIRDSAGNTAEKEIKFRVLEARLLIGDVLSIVSYPKGIDANAGTEVDVSLVILNPSAESIMNISARIEGLPAGASFIANDSGTVAAGADVEITGKLSIAKTVTAGTYELTLIAESEKYYDAVPIILNVESTGQGAALVGMFGLVESFWLGLIVLAVIAAIVVANRVYKSRAQNSVKARI